jgi:hypothetical protein
LTGVTFGGKNVSRVPRKRRTANYLFVVRQYKNAQQSIFYRTFFAVRHYKNAQQSIFLPDIFFCRAPKKMCMTKYAQQRSKRTENIDFPIVSASSDLLPPPPTSGFADAPTSPRWQGPGTATGHEERD